MSEIEQNIDLILLNGKTLLLIKEKYPEINVILDQLGHDLDKKKNLIDFLNEKNNIPEDHIFLDSVLNEAINMKLQSGGGALADSQASYDNPDLYKIYKVDKTSGAWESFIKDIRTKILFTSFSVIDKGDYLEVYFI
jgi:hypothetical protein